MNEGLEKGGPTVNKIIKGLKVSSNAHSVIINSENNEQRWLFWIFPCPCFCIWAITRACLSAIYKIFDIEFGSKAPSLKRIDVESVDLDEENRLIDSVDIAIHLEYSGGFAIGIDAELAYEKTAQLTAKGNMIHWCIATMIRCDRDNSVMKLFTGYLVKP